METKNQQILTLLDAPSTNGTAGRRTSIDIGEREFDQERAETLHEQVWAYRMNRRNRLLLLNLARGFGGVEIYVEKLVNVLKDDMELFAVIADRLRTMGVRVYRTPERLPRVFRYLAGAMLAAWVILRHGIDQVHDNAYGESIVLPFLAVFGPRRYQTCHHLPPTTPMAFLYRRIFSSMEKVCCVSKTTEAAVHRFLGHSANVFTIENWIEIPAARPKVSRPSGDAFRILFVGRLQDYKGAQLLVEAVRGLEGVELIIVGRGPYQQELERAVDGLPHVRMCGFLNDEELEPWYATSDVIANPSMGPEGSSMVGLDALARGIPCLMSDIPTFRELVEDSQAAALFRSGDVEDLRVKLVELRDNPGLREALVSRGIQLVRDKHSSSTAREQYRIFFDI